MRSSHFVAGDHAMRGTNKSSFLSIIIHKLFYRAPFCFAIVFAVVLFSFPFVLLILLLIFSSRTQNYSCLQRIIVCSEFRFVWSFHCVVSRLVDMNRREKKRFECHKYKLASYECTVLFTVQMYNSFPSKTHFCISTIRFSIGQL